MHFTVLCRLFQNVMSFVTSHYYRRHTFKRDDYDLFTHYSSVIQTRWTGRRVNYIDYAEHQCLPSTTLYSWLQEALSVALVTCSGGRCVSSSSSSSAVAAAGVRELVAVLARRRHAINDDSVVAHSLVAVVCQ